MLRRELSEGLMRPHGVVAALLSGEEPAQLFQRIRWEEHLVEHLFVGRLARPTQPLGFGRQDKEAEAPVTASLLKLRLDSEPPSTWSARTGPGHALDNGIEESRAMAAVARQ